MKKLSLSKIVIIVLALAGLTGCISMDSLTSLYGYKQVEKGHILANDKVLIVAKMGFDVDPYELFNVKNSNIPEEEGFSQYRSVMLGFVQGNHEIDEDFTKMKKKMMVSSWDQYLVCEIDRADYISIATILYLYGDDSTTDYKFSQTIKVKIEENDRFIYIGDLNSSMLNKNELGVNDPQLTIKDDFSSAELSLSEFAYDINGEVIPVTKVLAQSKEIVSLTGTVTKTR